MSSRYKPKPLPPLRPSHAPQKGPRPCDDFFRRMHADMVEMFPENYQRADDLPYGVWITEDGTQYLFDRQYRPMWQRQPGEPATRADPAEWIPWRVVYMLHDDKPSPHHSKRLREALLAVVQVFLEGGPLYARKWVPPVTGMLVAQAPIPIIKLVHDDTDPEDST